MRIERHATPAAFLDAAGAFLAEREALLNLPIAIADGMRRRGEGEGAYFATIEDGEVRAIALMTPPYGLHVSPLPAEAVALLVADLERHGFSPTAVQGPRDSAHAFADAWCRPRGSRATPRMDLRIHALTAVEGTRTAPGAPRLATAADVPLVASWIDAFARETGAPMHGDSTALAARSIESESYWLWIDEGVVAMAAFVGRTPNGRRIGAVYTPASRRRRGYAEVLVADMSARALTEARFCFLFTDVTNPTSNAIYSRIGYRPIGDVRELAFA